MRRLLPLILLLLLLFAAPGVRADDEQESEDDAKARALDRQALLREAERKVGVRPNQESDAALETLKRKLAEDTRFLMQYEVSSEEERELLKEFQKTIEERILFLGEPAEGEEEGASTTIGALHEARLLYGWLIGETPCDILVQAAGKPLAAEAGMRSYRYPPEEPKSEADEEGGTEEAGTDEVGAPEGDLGPAPEGPPPPAGGASEAPAKAGDEAKPKDGAAKEEPEAKPEEKPGAAPEPSKPPDAETWAKETVLPAEHGTLLGKIVAPAKCGTVSSLEAVAKREPAYLHKDDVEGLQRHVLLGGDAFAYNRPYVALRLIQSDQRNLAMQEDQPPAAYVSQSMVEEKEKAVEAYRKERDLRRRQHDAVIDQLDAIVLAVDAWKEQGALLLQQIEELKAQVEPAPKPGPAEAPSGERPPVPPPDPVLALRLRLARARESLTSLELTLIYLTAVRARERLTQIDGLERAAEEETTAADQVLARYREKLAEMRDERRMDRLVSAERRLRRWAKEEADAPEGSIEAKRRAAYQALVELHEVVREAVATRRRVTTRGRDEAQETPPAARPKAKGKEKEQGKTDNEKTSPSDAPKRELSAIVRDPASATWDVKYVEIATRELEDPALRRPFDAGLVAEHYALADDQIRGLLLAMESAQEHAALKPRYAAALEKVDAALAALGQDRVTIHPQGARNLPELFRAAQEDFESAKEGFLGARQRNLDRLAALREYRKKLLAQGSRSLLIRTDRDLADADVDGALEDARSALRKAREWVTTAQDDNAGTWAKRAWPRILGALALLAVVIVLIRRGRRIIDTRIEKLAAVHPALRKEGASVKDERAEARRRREEEEEAQKVVSEEDVLRQVTAEAAAVSAPLPEEAEGKDEAPEDDDDKEAAR